MRCLILRQNCMLWWIAETATHSLHSYFHVSLQCDLETPRIKMWGPSPFLLNLNLAKWPGLTNGHRCTWHKRDLWRTCWLESCPLAAFRTKPLCEESQNRRHGIEMRCAIWALRLTSLLISRHVSEAILNHLPPSQPQIHKRSQQILMKPFR